MNGEFQKVAKQWKLGKISTAQKLAKNLTRKNIRRTLGCEG